MGLTQIIGSAYAPTSTQTQLAHAETAKDARRYAATMLLQDPSLLKVLSSRDVPSLRYFCRLDAPPGEIQTLLRDVRGLPPEKQAALMFPAVSPNGKGLVLLCDVAATRVVEQDGAFSGVPYAEVVASYCRARDAVVHAVLGYVLKLANDVVAQHYPRASREDKVSDLFMAGYGFMMSLFDFYERDPAREPASFLTYISVSMAKRLHEYARRDGCSRRHFNRKEDVFSRPISLDAIMGDDASPELAVLRRALVGPPGQYDALPFIDAETVLGLLSDSDATLLRQRYGIGTPRLTLGEIGKGCGVTRERIRQREQKALQHASELLHRRMRRIRADEA